MAEFKDKIVNIITNEKARSLYNEVKDLPIIDYHCHLSPKAIYEDLPFDNIGSLWLDGDHYKWRLMRFYGVDEKYITGDSKIKEKYSHFMEVVSTAYGNPIQDWVKLELAEFFDIKLPLNMENAEEIWERANKVIKEKKLSPKKLILQSKVEFIATTDDVCDNLEYHKLLKNSIEVLVTPSFRTDKLFMIMEESYPIYLEKLSACSGEIIKDIDSFAVAVEKRLAYFVENGCKFSDIGIQGFPKRIASYEEANSIILKRIGKKAVTAEEQETFQGYLYLMLGKLYHKYEVLQQWHLACKRNSNTLMKQRLGVDSGFDCVGESLSIDAITNILDILSQDNALTKTVIYTLNPTMYYPLITMCGAFRGVVMGISWWFCDHKRGMFELLDMWSELSHVGTLIGMLTDSRSFLSYIRHDYYRQVICEFLSKFLDDGNKKEISATAYNLCYGNAKNIIQ